MNMQYANTSSVHRHNLSTLLLLRINPLYIRIYILWMNLLLLIIGPFLVLIVLNVRTYNKIKDFEQTLNDTLRVRFTRGSSAGVGGNGSGEGGGGMALTETTQGRGIRGT
jgi:Flp pilus assembly protein TadB